MKKILVLTGAGVSKESGIQTFRDLVDGLWYNHSVEDVATPEGWRKDREKVLDFYNKRRAQLNEVQPNSAHFSIADLEKDFQVLLVTQNVDDLHERAGSKNIVHLHGELIKARSTFDPSIVIEWRGDINLGHKCPKGSQLRPHIVWFGESLNSSDMKVATDFASDCDVCIVVGTSMQVQPANSIPFLTKQDCLIYYVDPGDIDFKITDYRAAFFTHVKEPATVGMEKVKEELIKIFLK